MDPNPQDPSRGTGLWLQRADTAGVRSDAEGKAPDVIALDNRETLDVYRALRGPDRSGMMSAQEAAGNLAFARALLIEARSGRQGGEIDFDVDASQVIDPEQGSCLDVRSQRAASGLWQSLLRARQTARRANSCLPIAGFRP